MIVFNGLRPEFSERNNPVGRHFGDTGFRFICEFHSLVFVRKHDGLFSPVRRAFSPDAAECGPVFLTNDPCNWNPLAGSPWCRACSLGRAGIPIARHGRRYCFASGITGLPRPQLLAWAVKLTRGRAASMGGPVAFRYLSAFPVIAGGKAAPSNTPTRKKTRPGKRCHVPTIARAGEFVSINTLERTLTPAGTCHSLTTSQHSRGLSVKQYFGNLGFACAYFMT